MSRSRRKFRLKKCIFGRHLISYRERKYACTVLQYVHERNAEFLHCRQRREMPIVDE